MRAHRLSIILLLGALWMAPAVRADDGARPGTVARQNYSYDPRARAVTLELTTVYGGRDADGFRAFYTRTGPAGYRKAKLDYYRTMYDAVAEAAPPTVKDDGNVIEARERYAVSLAGPEDDTALHRFPIYPDLLRGFFSTLPPTIRQPYTLSGSSDRRDIVSVDAPTLGTYTLRDGVVTSRYFAFTRKVGARPGHIEMDYRLRFLTDQVPVADFEQYRGDIERMDHEIYAWIDLDRDFYHRYSRDIPTLIQVGAMTAGLVAAGVWRTMRRRRVTLRS